VPPTIVKSIAPSSKPLQLIFQPPAKLSASTDSVNTGGSRRITTVSIKQPLASDTTTSYVPAVNPLGLETTVSCPAGIFPSTVVHEYI
jgi:hypothetical protein